MYYIMKIPVGDMKVMIPKERVDAIGLREIVDKNSVKKVLAILKAEETNVNHNWNQRYRANLEKIRSGDIYQVAEVIRNLVFLDDEKGLSTGEKKMLENAKQILVSELVLAKDIEEEQAHEIINDTLLTTS